MANWSNPTLTSLYTDFVTEVKNRDVDLALGLDPATTSPTNVPTNAIRWNSASFKYQKWDGSTWNDLSTKYIFTAVEVSGSTVPVNGMYLSTTNTLNFSTASTASRLTIDGSGNVNIDSGTFYVDAVNNRVGVGTTGPNYPIDVQVPGGLIANFQTSTANTYGTIRLTGNARGGELDFYNGATALASIYASTLKDIQFATNGTSSVAMTLDASGNLGLGVVPSAWANSKAFDCGAWGSVSVDTVADANLSLAWNSYATAYNAWKYKNAAAASKYTQAAGAHQWYTAPSWNGTGSDVITFTQAMTLDASGNLGIGETSPTNRLHVKGTQNTVYSPNDTLAGGVLAYFKNASTTDSTDATIRLEATGSTNFALVTLSSVHTGDGSSAFTVGTRNAGGSVTERARIDSSGRLLVGTSSTSANSTITCQGHSGVSTGEAWLRLNRGVTTPSSGDTLGALIFGDSTACDAAYVYAQRDGGTWSGSSKPTRLVFSTTADGAATPTPRMQINNLGYMQGTVNGLGAGRIPAKQYYRLDSARNGVNQAAAQSVFGVGVTLVGSTVYEFEALYWLQCSSASGSPTMNFLFGGTATLNNIMYSGVGPGSTSVLPPVSFYDAAPTSFITNVATASTVSGTLTSAISVVYLIKGTVSVNAGGTFIPQYSFDVAPGNLFTTNAGSYFSIWPLAASGAAVNIGSWA